MPGAARQTARPRRAHRSCHSGQRRRRVRARLACGRARPPGDGRTRQAGHHQRAGRDRLDRSRRRRRDQRHGRGGRDQPRRQERALQGWLYRPGPHRISRQDVVSADRQSGVAGDDAVVARSRGGAGDDPHPSQGRAGASHPRPDLRDRPGRGARSDRSLRHRQTAARGRRPQSARRRGRQHGQRGRQHRAARGRAAGRRRHRRPRTAAGRHHVPPGRARDLRCGAVHVSRPGADPDQDARLRSRRQRHARPAVRAHLTRSRHRIRHRRHRPGRSVESRRRAEACGAACRGGPATDFRTRAPS